MIDPVAIRKLELAPQEAFLLSRIDGEVTFGELSLMCGLDPESLQAAVQRLVRLRVLVRLDHRRPLSKTVKIPGSDPPVKPKAKVSRASKALRQRAKTRKLDMLRKQIYAGSRRSEPADRVPLVSVSVSVARPQTPEPSCPVNPGGRSRTPARGIAKGGRTRSITQPLTVQAPEASPSSEPESSECFVEPWASAVVDESLIDDTLAISPARQRTLLQMSEMLDELRPFDLLAMAYCDDSAAIRRAFHQQSRWLHPDAYHGKELGRYRALLAQVFTKVRQAYEDLQCAQARQRYAA